ncbi:proline dehydrogenase 1, mitochondrial-like [Lacerta agilis]|uniref:proline dehydrogenase 1, mitochondrial-like n=1 Tax=Lacerta agilis TaxID=80427 RepID=UPI00141A597A|nr:proline dehydrogenase 1, mitochondrial-like [Lacerta agilis]
MAGSCRSSKGALLALRAAQSFALRSCPRSATAAATAPAPPEQPLPDPAQPPPALSAGARLQQPPSTLPPPPAVDFADAQEAFRSKSSGELARGLLVLGLCSFQPLVEHGDKLMCFSRKLLGQWLFEKLMKLTFYGQFVAGEDQEAIKPLIRRYSACGVGSVLDYSVEEDLTHEEAEKKELDSCTSAFEKETGKQREKRYSVHRKFGDRRDGVISARTYFYADESKCDRHMDTFLRCIEASGGSSEDGFSAIKLTALGRPQFLLQFSEVLVKWRRFFHQLAAEQGKVGLAALETKLEVEKLQEALAKLGVATKAESQNWFTGEKLGVSGTVDLLDWNSLIDSRTEISKLLLTPNIKTGQLEPLLSRFTEEEERQMKRMLQRMDVLAKKAVETGVRLMVDAEQTYFQPAISRLTLEMQRKFNRERAAVFNTYQCYLKDAYDTVTVDVELSRREAWHFGAKLVRGAYMEQERSRAAEVGYEDPINLTYQATSEMYHRCLDYILEEIRHSRKANVMVASHNKDTVKFTLRRMADLGIHPSENKIYFGQLLGMCDQITFPLGQAGYPVYKYVPYGPVNEVLPYLSRRAQENQGFMARAKEEQDLLWMELKRRLFAGTLLSAPALP